MPLLINDIKRQNQALADELSKAIESVFERGWYILGPEVEAFEQEFASYCGVACCVSVANGTDALELAVRSLELGEGAFVATVANAGMYATTAIKQAGSRPLYVDVSAETMTMDPVALGSCISGNTGAVIVTHLYGQMAAITEIRDIARAAGVPLIEDCAQAHGAEIDGRKAGAWGTIGCFSFYPTKNLGALGDGGAIITNDETIASRVRKLRQYGWASKYHSDVAGGRNSRLDELQAAMLRVKLRRLDIWNQRRREIACRYSAAFDGMPLVVPHASSKSYVAHLYVVRSAARNQLRKQLESSGIATDIHYPVPDYAQKSFTANAAATPMTLPVTEACCAQVLTLPCFPEMSSAEIDQVIQGVRATIQTEVISQ